MSHYACRGFLIAHTKLGGLTGVELCLYMYFMLKFVDSLHHLLALIFGTHLDISYLQGWRCVFLIKVLNYMKTTYTYRIKMLS